jgi:hypothetical protein
VDGRHAFVVWHPAGQAAQTNGAPALQDLATNSAPVSANFTYGFPPLSLTLFTLAPGPCTLSVLQVQPANVQLQLAGQPGTPYVIQSSTNLSSSVWVPVSTNRLSGSTLTISLPVAGGTPLQYYRAVWQP